jgi:DNA-directed RNA polymerase subunit H (RpoH/RPB5)
MSERLEKLQQVCIEMFEQRGYSNLEIDEDKLTADKRDGKKICAFLSPIPKFNTEVAQQYINWMNELGINHTIIVYKETITSSAQKIIDSLPSLSLTGDMDINIELFCEDDLQYNITKHYLQPKFEFVEDSKEFKKVYGNKFPIILSDDPIVKFFNYKSGDVIKITRKNGHVAYRIVK